MPLMLASQQDLSVRRRCDYHRFLHKNARHQSAGQSEPEYNRFQANTYIEYGSAGDNRLCACGRLESFPPILLRPSRNQWVFRDIDVPGACPLMRPPERTYILTLQTAKLDTRN